MENNDQEVILKPKNWKIWHGIKAAVQVINIVLLIILLIATYNAPVKYFILNEIPTDEAVVTFIHTLIFSSIIFAIACGIEAKADLSYGAYACKACGHLHRPDPKKNYYSIFNYAKMVCPKCGRISWHDKIMPRE